MRLVIKIKETFRENREVYGYRRIKKKLTNAGYHCNHKWIRRLMKINDIRLLQKRKYRVTTTDSRGNKIIYPNLLTSRKAKYPGEILVSNITYISTTEGRF